MIEPVFSLLASETGPVPTVRAEVLDVARRAMSENSWRALRADLKVFAQWAQANGFASLPASPQTVACFLRDQAEVGKKAAMLSRYASSIARAHALADLADPTKAELVRLELKAQRRALGVRQKQALTAWRDASGTVEGAVFRRLHRVRDKAGTDIWTSGAGMTPQSVTLIYRALLDAAREAGLLGAIAETDFDHWRRSLTTHSTRVGLTQDLFANGQDLAGIMQALRWKSAQQPARDAQALSAEANAAARVVGKL